LENHPLLRSSPFTSPDPTIMRSLRNFAYAMHPVSIINAKQHFAVYLFSRRVCLLSFTIVLA